MHCLLCDTCHAPFMNPFLLRLHSCTQGPPSVSVLPAGCTQMLQMPFQRRRRRMACCMQAVAEPGAVKVHEDFRIQMCAGVSPRHHANVQEGLVDSKGVLDSVDINVLMRRRAHSNPTECWAQSMSIC